VFAVAEMLGQPPHEIEKWSVVEFREFIAYLKLKKEYENVS